MASWSQRRKLIYGGITALIACTVIALPAFFFFYKAPTCFDGVQDGNETGVDCGGSCQRLCSSAFSAPIVSWARIEPLTSNLYNVATYIINPNVSAVALNVPYHVIIYDNQGVEITEYSGTVTLPPHRNTLAFNSQISMGKRIPDRALFQFTASPQWQSVSDPLTGIQIGNKQYSEGSTGASLLVTLSNASVNPINTTDVYVVLYDKNGNAIGFSKTVIDSIPGYGSVVAPFTWPESFNGKVISIEVLPVAE